MPAKDNPQSGPVVPVQTGQTGHQAAHQLGVQKPQVHTQPQLHTQVKAPVASERREAVREHTVAVQEKRDVAHATAHDMGAKHVDRAKFYAGNDRIDLQGNHVQRVRELQEENDHLQREIIAKEGEIAECGDPLSVLADIEHRKVIISRNTGEILKIYLKNEERIKRIKELETHNARIQKEINDMQARFIATKDLDEKTRFASEFFILKSEIERNSREIDELSKK